MNNFYNNNTLQIRLHGHTHSQFEATRGIRQGCPLSPLIFAIATDSLLRIINKKLPQAHMRTFADDTATVIPSWTKNSKKLHKLMSTYSNITTMDINLTKTIAIALGDHPPDTTTENTPQYTWATEGRYLGFMVGPTAIESSWKTPIERYNQKLREWPWSKIGLHLSIRIYNIFILPTLLFVAQLTHPTQEAFQNESKAQAKLAPGPRTWCQMQELHHLKDLHATVEARALDTNAKATMLRTAIWENHAQGGLQLEHMAKEMEKALQKSPHFGRAVKHIQWHKSHFCTTLHNHKKNMATLGLTEHNLRNTITNNTPLPLDKKTRQIQTNHTTAHPQNTKRTLHIQHARKNPDAPCTLASKGMASYSCRQVHEQLAEHHEKPRTKSQPHVLAHGASQMVHQRALRTKTPQPLYDGL
jgi:hypothetical protein